VFELLRHALDVNGAWADFQDKGALDRQGRQQGRVQGADGHGALRKGLPPNIGKIIFMNLMMNLVTAGCCAPTTAPVPEAAAGPRTGTTAGTTAGKAPGETKIVVITALIAPPPSACPSALTGS
jgi:hypothetical protein